MMLNKTVRSPFNCDADGMLAFGSSGNPTEAIDRALFLTGPLVTLRHFISGLD